jgi:hypothetical protein
MTHTAESGLPVPEVFSLPIVRCPSCDHGIDPHGTDPGGQCGVGNENRVPCPCRWSPNDIAAWLLAHGVLHPPSVLQRLVDQWGAESMYDAFITRWPDAATSVTPPGGSDA